MQKLRVANFIFLMIVLIACQPSVDVQLTATSTPKPTSTSIPPTSTVTPFPTLSEEGPYLVLELSFQDTGEINLYNQDGSGRQVVKLPENSNSRISIKNISPNGNWIAFHAGSVNIGGDPENIPVTLYIMNINDGKVIKIADIVTEGYLQKIEKIADELKLSDPDRYNEVYDPNWVEGSVFRNFAWSIYSLSWSPDSKFLAFAGQIDGISSDVYVYDVESGLIQRTEESLQNVLYINWSPDGKYIVFHNSIPGSVYTGSDFYAIEYSSSIVLNPKLLRSGFWHTTLEWLSPTVLLITGTTDTAGRHNLQTLDIVTGKVTTLWEDSYGSYAIDYKNKLIAINASEHADVENFGVYFITFDGKSNKVLDGLYWLTFFYRGEEKHQFLGTGFSQIAELNIEGELIGLTSDYKSNVIGKFNYMQVKVSPDYSWLLTYDESGMYLYDRNDELVKEFTILGVYDVIWSPNSQGFFYSTGKELFYLSINDGKDVFVDMCLPLEAYCRFIFSEFNSRWIN